MDGGKVWWRSNYDRNRRGISEGPGGAAPPGRLWLQRLQQDFPVPAKGLTKAGIRKMIARLHEELAVYEGSREVHQPETSS
jgi:hypothetical protein